MSRIVEGLFEWNQVELSLSFTELFVLMEQL